MQADATIQAARIAARARYVHACTTLVGAVGVFGGFAFNMYVQTWDMKELTETIRQQAMNKDDLLRELAAANRALAEIFERAQAKAAQDRAQEIDDKLR